jgi:hypothetical protein
VPNRRGVEEGSPGRVPVARETEAARVPAMPSAEERAAFAAENADEEPRADPRLRLLGSYVAQSLRPAAGAWERCAGTAEAEQLLQAFLGGDAAEEPRPLLVVRPGPGGLAVRPGLDAGPESGPARAKGLYFLRTRAEPPGINSLRAAVLCGDLPAAPLEHLAILFSEVRVGCWPRADRTWGGGEGGAVRAEAGPDGEGRSFRGRAKGRGHRQRGKARAEKLTMCPVREENGMGWEQSQKRVEGRSWMETKTRTRHLRRGWHG